MEVQVAQPAGKLNPAPGDLRNRRTHSVNNPLPGAGNNRRVCAGRRTDRFRAPAPAGMAKMRSKQKLTGAARAGFRHARDRLPNNQLIFQMERRRVPKLFLRSLNYVCHSRTYLESLKTSLAFQPPNPACT